MRLILAALAVGVSATSAAADQRTFEFLGGHGCTVSEASLDALANAGFLEPYTNAIIADAIARGVAKQEGDYVVLDESICTIRLPDIQSDLTTTSPEIQAMAPYERTVLEYDGVEDVYEGCFFKDPMTLFTDLADGDEDKAYANYIRFLGAAIMSGDARFYSRSPLVTPASLQIVTGECARAPNASEIMESHDYILSGFGDYVRFAGENTPCGEGLSYKLGAFIAEAQGADMGDDFKFRRGVNAMAAFEFQLIAMAAGWYDGQSATDRGLPRPPLCHYTE